jgi:hypothetical protein
MNRRSIATRVGNALIGAVQVLGVSTAILKREARQHTHTRFFVCGFFMYFFFMFYTRTGFCQASSCC